MDMRTSPITGKAVQYKIDHSSSPTGFTYKHGNQDGVANLRVSESFAVQMRQENRNPALVGIRKDRSDSAWNLIRSELWRHRLLDTGRILYLTSEKESARIIEMVDVSEGTANPYIVKSFESFISDAEGFNLRRKAIETLRNLFFYYQVNEKFPDIVYAICYGDDARGIEFTQDVSLEEGMTYACNTGEARMVYEYLLDSGLITARLYNSHLYWKLTSKGIAQIDDIEQGRNKIRNLCFVVRKFDDSLDEFFQPIFNEIAADLGIEIMPVWGEDHNEKIDERIFRLISEASVVLVDVDPTRYNVGLEHGYAMGLGKPIITMMNKNRYEEGLCEPLKIKLNDLPFDIATQNCSFYEIPHDESERQRQSNRLKAVLRARISVALQSK
jgi:hypothetical protein